MRFKEFMSESKTSEQAFKMGLKYMGFARYGKNGKVTHVVRNGQLIAVTPASDDWVKEEKWSNDGKAIDGKTLLDIIGKTRLNMMINSPWWKKHIASFSYDTIFRHHTDRLGNHHVEAYAYSAYAPKVNNKTVAIKLLQFSFTKNGINNIHLFRNDSLPDDERIHWKYIESYRNED